MPILNMIAQGSGGWWGNIWEPLNLTVTTSWLDATITWEDNEIWTIPPTTFQKSELVRKIGSAPTSPSDWVLVVTETVKDTYKTTWYVDQWLTDWETYYYRIFSYSDLGGISYCDAVSVTPSPWRQPWANTVFYFPLSEDMLDHSGNSVSASGWWTITYQWWAGALISSKITINYSTQPTDFTALCYMKNITSSDIILGYGNIQDSWWYKWWDISCNIYNAWQPNSLRIQCLWSSPTWKQSFTPTWWDTTTRHLVTFVKDGTNSMWYFYINGSLVGSQSLVWTASTWNYFLCDGSSMYFWDVILEDKIWSAQEISDYYNQTKWDYWL